MIDKFLGGEIWREAIFGGEGRGVCVCKGEEQGGRGVCVGGGGDNGLVDVFPSSKFNNAFQIVIKLLSRYVKICM